MHYKHANSELVSENVFISIAKNDVIKGNESGIYLLRQANKCDCLKV